MTTEKTQTTSVREEIHRITKEAAFNSKIYLQNWIENLIEKECKKNKTMNKQR